MLPSQDAEEKKTLQIKPFTCVTLQIHLIPCKAKCSYSETKAALAELKAAVDKAVVKKAVARHTKSVPCAEFAEKVTAIAAKAAECSATPGLAAVIKAELAELPATCTDAEKEALKAAASSVDAAFASVDAEICSLQTAIESKFKFSIQINKYHPDLLFQP